MLCSVTALIFASVNVLLAQPAAPLAVEPAASSISGIILSDLKLPESLGSIDLKINATGDDRPFIAVIQDAHAVIDAQNNIHEIIRYMQEHYGIELIALEGGTGKLDPTLFRTFPNEFVKKKVLEDYLKKGELTGAEMAAALNQAEGEYYGIEDWDLYEEHYISYLRATEQKGNLLKRLSGIRSELDRKRAKIYSAELNEFHENILKYESENTYLLEFLKYIGSFERAKQKFTQYPDLEKLYRSYDFEKDHEQDKGTIELSVRQMAESFKATYVKRMNIKQEMTFHRNYQAFVTGQMDAGQFLKYLIQEGQSFGVKAKLTPSMLKLLGHNETLATIKGTKLFEELQALIAEIQAELMTKQEERVLADMYQRLRALENLANLELTRSQWDDLERNPEPYLSIIGHKDEAIRHGIQFYKLAVRRDKAFSQNLQRLMKDRHAKSAIVIAGGFHTQGFEKNLKDEGFSFSVITPKIQSLNGHETYASIMQGNISYKPYLRTTFYDAFMRDSTVKMVGSLSEPDFRRDMKLWRDEIIRKLSKERKLSKVREYTRYIDLVYKIYHEKFGQGNRSSQSQEKIVKAIEQELKEFGRDAIGRHREKLDWQIRQFSEGLEALIRQNDLGVSQVTALVSQVRAAEPATLSLFPALSQMIPPSAPIKRMSPVIQSQILGGKVIDETGLPAVDGENEQGLVDIIAPIGVAQILDRTDPSAGGAEGFLRNLGHQPAIRAGGLDVTQGNLPPKLISGRSEVRNLDDKNILDRDMKFKRKEELSQRGDIYEIVMNFAGRVSNFYRAHDEVKRPKILPDEFLAGQPEKSLTALRKVLEKIGSDSEETRKWIQKTDPNANLQKQIK
ncbi:MAG TPA: hypothetical protein VD913_00425, partial [bacterium]|nr:hypothetical protein [bacterium]